MMGIVPKIRNKPPHLEGGQWVYWEDVSPVSKFDEVAAWRYGWDDTHSIKIADMPPEMNVAGLRWFCTDMDWYAAQVQWRNAQFQQALSHMQGLSNANACQCCRRGAQGGGLFGNLFGGL